MDPVVVVGLDFGTTYSGFSLPTALNQQKFYVLRIGPLGMKLDEAGGRFYCIRQTSLFYVPARSGNSLELQGWGWPALVKYTKALQQFK